MVQCPIKSCNKRFKASGLKRHMTTMHPNYQKMKDQKIKVKRQIHYKIPPPPPDEPETIIIEKKLKIPKAPKKRRDPEDILDLITKIPPLMVLFAIFYFLFIDTRMVASMSEHPIIDLYGYIFTHITETGSIIILLLTTVIAIMVLFIFYKAVWRLAFPDLILKSHDEVCIESSNGTLITRPFFRKSTYEGRIMLGVGYGIWDNLYRKITKTPKPEIITLYLRRGTGVNGFLNPFRVLACCDKVCIQDSEHDRFTKDGLYRRTVKGTNFRRDFESNNLIYWIENDEYGQCSFNAKWYKKTHDHLIDTGLTKVTRTSLLDPTVQKEQQKKSLHILPGKTIDWSEKVQDMKDTKEQEKAER